MTETVPVTYLADGPVAPGRQCCFSSTLGFDQTVDALKAAILAEDLWVVAELDPQMLLLKGGYGIRPTRQIFYFHPRYMVRLLSANSAALVEAPLKFVVMCGPDGEVTVRHPGTIVAFSAYEGMTEIAGELADVTARILRKSGIAG
jgi:uncharacterized protein (DUF302 family)